MYYTKAYEDFMSRGIEVERDGIRLKSKETVIATLITYRFELSDGVLIVADIEEEGK